MIITIKTIKLQTLIKKKHKINYFSLKKVNNQNNNQCLIYFFYKFAINIFI
jgi:hypothetical protein